MHIGSQNGNWSGKLRSFFPTSSALTKKDIERTFLLMFCIFLGLFTLLLNFSYSKWNQYALAAQSLLQGTLYLNPALGGVFDSAFFHGLYFWPLGPFPTLVLVPFLALGNLLGVSIVEGNLQFFFSLGIFIACYALARRFSYSARDALYLAVAFCFASVYHQIALIPASWYFVQAVTVLLIFLSLLEYFAKRRWWVIGVLFGFIFMSRFTAGFGIFFFLADIVFSK